jgi:hypothetical protein
VWVSTSIKSFDLKIADHVCIHPWRTSSANGRFSIIPTPALISTTPRIW